MTASRHRNLRWLALLTLVTFTAALLTPHPAAAQTAYQVINPDGGTGLDDGLKIIVGDGRHQIVRNGEYQVYDYADESAWNGFIVDIHANDPIAGRAVLCTDDLHSSCPEESIAWELIGESFEQTGPQTWVSLQALQTAIESISTIVLTAYTLTYTAPNPYIDIEVTVATNSEDATLDLYYASDLSLDGQDEGEGFTDTVEGTRLYGQYSTAVPGGFSGIWENADSPMTSTFLGYYECAFAAFDYNDPGCSGDGPGGPTGAYGTPSTEFTDAGAGAHWRIIADGSAQIFTRSFRLLYSDFDYFSELSGIQRPTTAPQIACFEDIDMAVSPQFITLAPGGEATVEVALRNTNAARQGYNDVLVSFSDGLDVVSVSNGGLDLGQRAAWQKFSLEPNETRTFNVTVRAAETLNAAPVHITELYCGGRVMERIDGVFLTPAAAPAPAPVVEAAPAAAPAPADPAPLPAALPNTAGELPTNNALLMVVTGFVLAALLFGVRLVRR